jgi:hypothetical protein
VILNNADEPWTVLILLQNRLLETTVKSMKYMISWKIAPGHHKPAGKAFLKGGAPMPKGLSLIGRWHAPGSGYGWALVEGQDSTALAQHIAEWANLLEFQITPVIEDADAAKALSRVYGK